MLRRRLLGGKKIQIPNGVYAVAANDRDGSRNLYKYSDDIPSNERLVAFFIKETTTCFIIYVEANEYGKPIEDENTVHGLSWYYGSYYTSREQCLTHVSSNTYSQSPYGHDLGAVPYQAVAADLQDSSTTSQVLLLELGYDNKVPTIGDLEIIYNRLDDIAQLYGKVSDRSNNAGICKMWEGSWTYANGNYLYACVPTWREWTVQSGTPNSDTSYWKYGFSGDSPSNRIIGVWPYNSGMAHILRIYYPVIHKNNSYKYYYHGYQLTEDTWGTDDVGYVP